MRRSLRTSNATLARLRALPVLIRIDEVYAVLRSQRPMRPAREIALAMLDDAIGRVSGTSGLAASRQDFMRDGRGVIEDYVREAASDDFDQDDAEPQWVTKADAFHILNVEKPVDRSNEAAVNLLKTVERVAAGHFGKQAGRSIDAAMSRASEFFATDAGTGSAPLGRRRGRSGHCGKAAKIEDRRAEGQIGDSDENRVSFKNSPGRQPFTSDRFGRPLTDTGRESARGATCPAEGQRFCPISDARSVRFRVVC